MGGKIPRLVQTVGDLCSVFTRPGPPITQSPAPETYASVPQAQNMPSPIREGKTFRLIPSTDALCTLLMQTGIDQDFSTSIHGGEPLQATRIHRTYERFEEFVAVDKKRARRDEPAECVAVHNKYRRIVDSGSYSYKTRLPVPRATSSYVVAKTPMSTVSSHDLRDAYTADRAKTPMPHASTPNMQSATGFPGMRTPVAALSSASLRYAYNVGLDTPTITRRKRLPHPARASAAGNAPMSTLKIGAGVNHAPATTLSTPGKVVPVQSKKSATSLNPASNQNHATTSLQRSHLSTPKRNDMRPIVDGYLWTPNSSAAQATPTAQAPRTPHSQNMTLTTPAQPTPLDYNKIPQKITVINGVKRSVGHDERFPILRRVRKHNPVAGEGLMSTDTTAAAPGCTAAQVNEDVIMSGY